MGTACGVGCGGGGQGSLAYVGSGQGDYMQETTYKYAGCGGDFAQPRRDFTCLITTCCLLSLLLLIPLLLWLLSGTPTSLPYDCESGFAQWETTWSPAQQEFCCSTMGRGCTTARPETTPTVPPTPFPTPPPTPPPTQPPTRPPAPSGPVDPFNCAVDPENTWHADKKEWCCRVHHVGCPNQGGGCVTSSKPYDCNAGF